MTYVLILRCIRWRNKTHKHPKTKMPKIVIYKHWQCDWFEPSNNLIPLIQYSVILRKPSGLMFCPFKYTSSQLFTKKVHIQEMLEIKISNLSNEQWAQIYLYLLIYLCTSNFVVLFVWNVCFKYIFLKRMYLLLN